MARKPHSNRYIVSNALSVSMCWQMNVDLSNPSGEITGADPENLKGGVRNITNMLKVGWICP